MASQFPQTQVQKVPRKSNRKQDATAAKNASASRPGDSIRPKAPVTPGHDGRVQGAFLFTDWASI
ncbi:hypothetical protein U879_11970 [Defluviimonas sp. 20V17]|uniref:Uncharacterized protein n=1 Tax=Allgaiera indica TaxID=765699 RepID=A0AAN4UPX1_9RHOB|nr:hypothetical protein [Allgaiera indica]KDB03450.1 hypothetical protein U879_11970 [Defluviimonas sp. 20V17]GHE00247.1 hypothetical protein GCM10008024_10990 [Allgaiera indica]SDW64998.1 hypothetical protein SAMN05444006_105213 [Allgaiera indica]